MKKTSSQTVIVLVILIVAAVFAVQSILLYRKSVREEETFHELQTYYFSQNKGIRDSAETNSALNKDLTKIQNYPSLLWRLELGSIWKILIGIFLLLAGCLLALITMPMRLASLLFELLKSAQPSSKKT